MKSIILSIVAVLLVSYGALCQSNETDKNVYAIGRFDYRRAATAPEEQYDKKLRDQYIESVKSGDTARAKQLLGEYLGEKSLFPSYDELKSSSKGISLEDWKLHLFSESTFGN